MSEHPEDAGIAQAEKEIETARANAEQALGILFDAVAVHAQRWLPVEVERCVKSQPATTIQLGMQRLSQLKAQLDALCATLPQRVREWLRADSLWRHRPAHVPYGPGMYKNDYTFTVHTHRRGDTVISERHVPVLGDAVSKGLQAVVAKLLEPYGIHAAPERFALPWDDPSIAALNAYGKSLSPFYAALERRRILLAEKERRIAAEMWDKA